MWTVICECAHSDSVCQGCSAVGASCTVRTEHRTVGTSHRTPALDSQPADCTQTRQSQPTLSCFSPKCMAYETCQPRQQPALMAEVVHDQLVTKLHSKPLTPSAYLEPFCNSKCTKGCTYVQPLHSHPQTPAAGAAYCTRTLRTQPYLELFQSQVHGVCCCQSR